MVYPFIVCHVVAVQHNLITYFYPSEWHIKKHQTLSILTSRTVIPGSPLHHMANGFDPLMCFTLSIYTLSDRGNKICSMCTSHSALRTLLLWYLIKNWAVKKSLRQIFYSCIISGNGYSIKWLFKNKPQAVRDEKHEDSGVFSSYIRGTNLSVWRNKSPVSPPMPPPPSQTAYDPPFSF